ncbi:hypothetical protein IW140_003592 [Coemansia sp. RSA 1813]|nr:hypothetical protein EV178_003439 [Coemansia sp. RSA 1646]KAJ1769329.1 hypothetical protein LPJ74_004156 [Coemansia sp. RSA 1843]KAJ2089099.1 hypothetical protein IW138_003679 [Coemansia sp. RSA 986]KAJ2215643.1 hypothetical protein EV179_002054 [Coemansia sp. RSA 487]KAJ2568835.1 hypothetical protein IW140_003592 [Coemansia sp. RSA 1813]
MLLQILSRKARMVGKIVFSREFMYEAARTLAAWVALVIMAVWMIVCQQWSDMRWLRRFEHDETVLLHHRPHPAPAARVLRHWLRHLGFGFGFGHGRHSRHGGGGGPMHHPFAAPWPQYTILQDQVLEHLPVMERAWISDKLVGSSAVICLIGCLVMCRGWRERLMMLRRMGWMVTVLYFFRSITISVTTMPPSNASCTIFQPRNMWEILMATPQILAGTVSQCTDNVFSGHTVLFTISFLFLRTYATHWTVVAYSAGHAVVGILSVLLARYHYTVDVVVAMLLTYLVHRTYYAALDTAIWNRRVSTGEVVFLYQPKALQVPMAQHSENDQQRCSEEEEDEEECRSHTPYASSLSGGVLPPRLREPSLAPTVGSVSDDSVTIRLEHLKQPQYSQKPQTRYSSRHSSIDIVQEEQNSEHSEFEMQLLDQAHNSPLSFSTNQEASSEYARQDYTRILGTSRPAGSILPTIVAWMDGLDMRCK